MAIALGQGDSMLLVTLLYGVSSAHIILVLMGGLICTIHLNYLLHHMFVYATFLTVLRKKH